MAGAEQGHRMPWAVHEQRTTAEDQVRAAHRRAEADAARQATELTEWWAAGNAPPGLCVCDGPVGPHRYWCRAALLLDQRPAGAR